MLGGVANMIIFIAYHVILLLYIYYYLLLFFCQIKYLEPDQYYVNMGINVIKL